MSSIMPTDQTIAAISLSCLPSPPSLASIQDIRAVLQGLVGNLPVFYNGYNGYNGGAMTGCLGDQRLGRNALEVLHRLMAPQDARSRIA